MPPPWQLQMSYYLSPLCFPLLSGVITSESIVLGRKSFTVNGKCLKGRKML